MNHDARIIPLNAEHKPGVLNKWLGDSIGWWEGDTLVVETINVNPEGGSQAQLTRGGKIIDREGEVEGGKAHGQMTPCWRAG